MTVGSEMMKHRFQGEQVDLQMRLHRAASEYYLQRGRTKLPIVVIHLHGYEILAESESDARAIYEMVKP